MEVQTIYITSDHGGQELREIVYKKIKDNYPDLKIVDLVRQVGGNTPLDNFPEFAEILSQKILNQPKTLGIAICTSGQGMCIAMNRHAHIRAGLVTQKEQIESLIKHTMANSICLSNKFTNRKDLDFILEAFIKDSIFDVSSLEARHIERIKELK
jgi:ribose 5-phosphate isomerase B